MKTTPPITPSCPALTGDKIKRRRKWQPHKLNPTGPDYLVWRRLDRVRQMAVHWGAAFHDFILAAECLRDIGELDYVLVLWPRIRSKRLRYWASDVIVAAQWLQKHPLDTPSCSRIWPHLFPEKNPVHPVHPVHPV